MKRDIQKLSGKLYDLCIVGGGIQGACIAWEAVLRGLSVALVEKADFASATSANSLKIIHGGLRYLQHADFKRMRESIREQGILMRIAPHLVHPLPVLLPSHGFGLQGRNVYRLALMVNDLVGFDRNRFMDPQKLRPSGRVLSKAACLRLFPELKRCEVSGAAFFHDAQVYHSERLVLSFLKSAVRRGAVAVNYCKATGLIREAGVVSGVQLTDCITGNCFLARSKMVVNTAGPWMDELPSGVAMGRRRRKTRFVKAINLVTRPLLQGHAVGLAAPGGYHDSDAVINKGKRLFFIVPWRDVSTVGTYYLPYDGEADAFEVTREEIELFLRQINMAWPGAPLSLKDVRFVHGGLLPGLESARADEDIRLAKDYAINDHSAEGLKGLLSVMSVKYTTARCVAERVVDRAVSIMGFNAASSTSAKTPLEGGEIEDFADFLDAALQKEGAVIGEAAVRRLVYNYGAAYPRVLSYLPQSRLEGEMENTNLIAAETLFGIQEEMALTLSDIVFRRTEFGTAGHPGDAVLKCCGAVMAEAFGWPSEQLEREYREVRLRFLNPGQGYDKVSSDNGASLAHSAVQ